MGGLSFVAGRGWPRCTRDRAGPSIAGARRGRSSRSAILSGVPAQDRPTESAPDRIEEHLGSALDVAPPAQTGAAGPRAWWRGLDPGARRRLRIATVAGIAFVIVASVLLARFLQAENVERDADV